MTQVTNHGYKIVHNPGYDFDLGYKNESEFFHYPGFKFVTCCAGCAQEELFLFTIQPITKQTADIKKNVDDIE